MRYQRSPSRDETWHTDFWPTRYRNFPHLTHTLVQYHDKSVQRRDQAIFPARILVNYFIVIVCYRSASLIVLVVGIITSWPLLPVLISVYPSVASLGVFLVGLPRTWLFLFILRFVIFLWLIYLCFIFIFFQSLS
jgi:hypothetical protein